MSMGERLWMAHLLNKKSGRMVLATLDHGICVEPIKEETDVVAAPGVIGVPREAPLPCKIGMVNESREKWETPMLTGMISAELPEHQLKARAEGRWPSDPEIVKFSTRVAVELGADIVKGYYTGDPATFKELIAYCPASYVVLGGPSSSNVDVFLEFIREAINCDAKGVSVGRNVWAYPEPFALTRAICRIVHDNASMEEARRELR